MEILPTNVVAFPKKQTYDYSVIKMEGYKEIKTTYSIGLYDKNGMIQSYTITNVNDVDYLI